MIPITVIRYKESVTFIFRPQTFNCFCPTNHPIMTERAKLAYPPEWRIWGPYVSERQWGTVREDYSAGGNAWGYTTHDMARSKAWRWGEEGIGGFCDDKQTFCVALAIWNGKDPILKERFFGLTNPEGNHGEDVKELYYYLDGVPSHSYMKMLYKYPQAPFPYEQLVAENGRRNRMDPEYELLDSGIFDEDKYFDVFIEFAKNSEQDILVKYTVYNRGNQPAELHLLPTIWFRRTLHWQQPDTRPVISQNGANALLLQTKTIGDYHCYADGDYQFLFTENETNNQRLYGAPNAAPYVKDGINDYLVQGRQEAVSPQQQGTKVAVHHQLQVAAGGSATVKLRWSNQPLDDPFGSFDTIFAAQQQEANDFYNELQESKEEEARNVQRQAWAGLLWSKQFYHFNIQHWLTGDEGEPIPPASRKQGRNADWKHMIVADVISMPDKWEYPWFAAWDLAFHCIAYVAIDPDFAKQQLLLLLKETYMHPNGELPAYEWDFSDVNPPVHAIAAWQVYQADASATGKKDTLFLQQIFLKLLLNFTWWVNRKDDEGNNIFEGGFLGLDNIGVFDRIRPLPGGGTLEQADATSWMAAYSLHMYMIACELAESNPVYEDMAIKFGEHFFYIAGSMANMSNTPGKGLWSETDSFYYDVVRLPDGDWRRLKLRSLVGLMPLIAVDVLSEPELQKLPKVVQHMDWFMKQRPDLAALVSNWTAGDETQHLFSLLRGHRMKCLLRRMLDESEFLSNYGIRSISKVYGSQPYQYQLEGEMVEVKYTPGESETGMFGGNSNWRGPIWLPINYLLVESMLRFYEYFGDDFKIEMPTGSGQFTTIKEAANVVKRRIVSIFMRNEQGYRPVYGQCEKQQTDPHFKDYVQFFEYFHGETGKGLGASHQTGWSALVALLL
jgi:hypothetical protein